MATKNATNNKTGSLSLDPGASGDPFVQLSINLDDKFIYGVDDSDSDKFKIADANSLATANVFVMTADGERTLPLQPAFLAYNSSTDSNVTGSGQNVQVEFDTEIFDQGGDYNTSTDTFTAPVTGRYMFIFSISMSGLASNHDNPNFRVTTSNRIYLGGAMDFGAVRDVSGNLILQMVCFADMDITDTATCSCFVNGGSQTVDFVGGAGSTLGTFFAGYLAV